MPLCPDRTWMLMSSCSITDQFLSRFVRVQFVGVQILGVASSFQFGHILIRIGSWGICG
ncbi:hypothetical protein M6B38_208115 [Iris pallida]|uniref:Uncharacterized protein n=1 Tax=Iris pallida TaxID=29817 RepID=A0AAX6E596_IRIPA|nr:hypothetical protein M6B38_208115 [Iris pallida]